MVEIPFQRQLQQDLLGARDHRWCFWCSFRRFQRFIGNFILADHDRSSGPCVSAAEPFELVSVHDRRRADYLRRSSSEESIRAGPSTRLTRVIYSNGSVSNVSGQASFIAGFSSIATGLNFIVTVHKMRCPGMTWFRLPLFVWAMYATSVIVMLGTPVVAITLLLVVIWNELSTSEFSLPSSAATPSCSSTCSGSTQPSGGLHHDASWPGDHQRGHRRQLQEAYFRL